VGVRPELAGIDDVDASCSIRRRSSKSTSRASMLELFRIQRRFTGRLLITDKVR